jgi:uncharacterized protein (TIGR02594 family)
VAWGAAFVGHCREKAGIRSTRKLNARSYLDWGDEVPRLSEARPGDVVVFTRGVNPAEGHVAFLSRPAGSFVEVLGGNQSNAVTLAMYPVARLIGIRRAKAAVKAGAKAGADAAPVKAPQRIDIKAVQQGLKDLGYFEVGNIDGKYGPRTRAAVLAFRADNGLPLSPDISAELVAALKTAPPRPISPERAEGKPQGSRIVRSANVQIVTGVIGGAAAVASNVAPAIEQAEKANGLVTKLFQLLRLDVLLGPGLPWVLGGICAVVVLYAVITKMARVEDYRTGRTP